MYSAAGSAAHELSNFAFGAGDYDGAKSWADEAISCGRKAPLAFGLPAALLMSACIALARGELDDAERWMAEIKREPVVQTYVRARSWVTGYGLLIAWRKRGIVPNSEELAELLRLFQLTRTHVGMDYVAVMVYDLLYVAGRSSEAAETLRAYVASHRREHTPLHPELHLRVERENFKG
jgi:hypothetical protein